MNKEDSDIFDVANDLANQIILLIKPPKGISELILPTACLMAAALFIHEQDLIKEKAIELLEVLIETLKEKNELRQH